MGGLLLDAKREQEPKPRGRHPENALSPDFASTVAEPGRYCDGHGLYLEVQPSGSRSWVQRLAVGGRRREIGLGSFPLVSLDEARAEAFANRKLARAGGDPWPSGGPSPSRPSPRRPSGSGARCGRGGATRGTAATGCRA